MKISKTQCQLKKLGTKRKKSASSKSYPLKLSKLRYINVYLTLYVYCNVLYVIVGPQVHSVLNSFRIMKIKY